MKHKTLAIAFLAALALTACGKKADQEIGFKTLEDARNIARENALFNAAAYRAESPRMEGYEIVSHGDSTQTVDCPQGDGWATVKFMYVDKGSKRGKAMTASEADQSISKYTVKCSTVSAALGCYLDSDFEKKPFAKQENRCDSSLPFPLPKIAN